MIGKGVLGCGEILSLLISSVLCVAVLITASITVSIVDNIGMFNDRDEASRHEADGDSFRAVAGWMTFASAVGIISVAVLVVFRALMLGELLIIRYLTYAMVCVTLCFLLVIALIAGGVPTATSAAEVQDNYIDAMECEDRTDIADTCDDLAHLRNSQIATAFLAFVAAIMFGNVIFIVVLTMKWHG